jgi:UDP-N-acetylmuramoylalanine--D-glutamate ligase
VRVSQLEGRRVALWGWGREGRAAYAALRRDTGQGALPLTLFCSEGEVEQARSLDDPALRVETEASAERLAAFDVVIKSPGISPYRPEAAAAREHGTVFVGGTALWFAQRPDARAVCVTGTKGKSTTTALLAHLLRAGGHRTALCGNIGLPLLELLDGDAELWAIELSSYQTRDVAASGVRPEVAVVTNVFPEHLDWHGSEQRYVEDKLALLTDARPRIAVLNADDPRLAALSLPDSEVRWFGRAGGWHMRGDALHRGEDVILDTREVPVPGRHNRGNLCAVLTAIDALGFDGASLAPHAASFRPLPHRLQTLGVRDGITYVNDSISTTPHASLAALDVFRDRRVALLAGGHDRGLDWSGFAEAMKTRAPMAIVTMGQNGPRIHDLLAPLARAAGFSLDSAASVGSAALSTAMRGLASVSSRSLSAT